MEWSGRRVVPVAAALLAASGCVTTMRYRMPLDDSNPFREESLSCAQDCDSRGKGLACFRECPGVSITEDECWVDDKPPAAICKQEYRASGFAKFAGGFVLTLGLAVLLIAGG